MRISFACLLTVLCFSLGSPARADFVTDMRQCASIDYGRERLRCFDALAKELHKYQAAIPPGIAAPANSAPATAATPESGFGMERELANATPSSVRARIPGPFKGWNGKTEFKLDNGQVWRQLVADRFRVNLDSPMVTIEKGLFGGFYLKVDGYNKTVRVRRIK